MSETSAPRLAAIEILHETIGHGRSLASVTFQHPLTQEICYGTLRWYFKLNALLQSLSSLPSSQLDIEVRLILLSGFYQLLFMKAPGYAVVNESVNLAKKLKKCRASKFINAILRNFLRQSEQSVHHLVKDPSAIFSHPQWLYQKIITAWPKHAEAIFTANNAHPPFSLRINLLRAKREIYLPGKLNPHTPCGITLTKPKKVEKLLGFDAGHLSVQDNAAQLAAYLLDPQPGETILDACAAPGGKTAHLRERQPKLKQLVAVDIDERRLQRIQQNLTRLQLKAVLQCGDVTKPHTWWKGQHFDRILLDSPCSATGVIRRHPDIKLLRKANDIPALTQLQQSLLTAVWPLLKPGGLLLYATCSILPEENQENIATFLQKHPDAQEKPIVANWGLSVRYGRQILPGMEDMDGFYYCCLIKNANTLSNHTV